VREVEYKQEAGGGRRKRSTNEKQVCRMNRSTNNQETGRKGEEEDKREAGIGEGKIRTCE